MLAPHCRHWRCSSSPQSQQVTIKPFLSLQICHVGLGADHDIRWQACCCCHTPHLAPCTHRRRLCHILWYGNSSYQLRWLRRQRQRDAQVRATRPLRSATCAAPFSPDLVVTPLPPFYPADCLQHADIHLNIPLAGSRRFHPRLRRARRASMGVLSTHAARVSEIPTHAHTRTQTHTHTLSLSPLPKRPYPYPNLCTLCPPPRRQLEVRELSGRSVLFRGRVGHTTVNNSLAIASPQSQQGAQLYVCCNDSAVRCFALPSMAPQATIRCPCPINYAALSPDGRQLVAVGDCEPTLLYTAAPAGACITDNGLKQLVLWLLDGAAPLSCLGCAVLHSHSWWCEERAVFVNPPH